MLYTVCKRIPSTTVYCFWLPLVAGAGVSFIYHYIHLDLVLVLSGIGDPWGRVSYCNDHGTPKLTQSSQQPSKLVDEQQLRQPMH